MKRLIFSWTMLLVFGTSAFAGPTPASKPNPGNTMESDKGKTGLFHKVENKNSSLGFLYDVFGYEKNDKVSFMITSEAKFSGMLTDITISEEGNEQFTFSSADEKGLTLTLTVMRHGDPDLVSYLCKLSSPQHAYSLILDKQPDMDICCWKKDFICSY
jgi:hypothetical protein